MKKFLFAHLILLNLTISSVASAAVWKAHNEWNPNWERRYSDWVRDEFKTDFFTKGRWAGVSADCADALYFARLIFSYENSLPYQILDATRTETYITNEWTKWDSTPEGQPRVRSMMNWLIDVVSTTTLASDTYPIAINREAVTPGQIWIRPSMHRTFIAQVGDIFRTGTSNPDPGHSEIVSSVSDSGIVSLMGSTRPAAVRKMTIMSSFRMLPVNRNLGLRAWKWPEHYGQSESRLPHFSLEQYKMGYTTEKNIDGSRRSRTTRSMMDFEEQVQKRLALRPETQEERVQRLAVEFCDLAHNRAEIVMEAEAFKKQKNGRCMNASDYDSFSTPARDKRLLQSIEDLTKYVGRGSFTGERIQSAEFREKMSFCEDLPLSSGAKLSILRFAQALSEGKISDNPNHSEEARWGLARSQSRCPSY